MYLKTYNQSVNVKAHASVVIITIFADNAPSCPMFFAITKPLTVVGEPSIIKIATSLSCVNPILIAIGKKTAVNTISFITLAKMAGESADFAFFICSSHGCIGGRSGS